MATKVEFMVGRAKEGSLPPGRPPWDPWNGLRVGLLVGGVFGVLAVWLVGSNSYWLALLAAGIGGAWGYAMQRVAIAGEVSARSRSALDAVSTALVIGGCLALGAVPIVAPRVSDGFPTDLAVSHVTAVARTPHAMGSEEIGRVRDYLVEALTEMGLSPQTQTVPAPDYFGPPGGTVEVTNVIARLKGTQTLGATLLVAHYDTVPFSPGANDNAAAVAALLETGRALVADPPPRDVILLFTDGEEPQPRFGMSAFTAHPWFEDVELAVNFEGIGTGGPPLLVELSGPTGTLVDRLAVSTGHPAAFSFLTATAELIGGASTDFDVIRAAGVPGYSFAYLRGSSIYHTERDRSDSLNVRGLGQQASLALGIAQNGGTWSDGSSVDRPVFFTVPGGVVVRYGRGAAVVSGMVAAALLGWIAWRRLPAEAGIRRLGRAVGLILSGSLMATVLLTAAWMGIGKLRGDMGFVEGYLWLLVLAGAALGCWFAIWRRSRRTGAEILGGMAAIWGLLAISTALGLPSMSYLFVWPALAAGVTVLVDAVGRGPHSRLLRLAIFSLPAAIVLVPALDTLSLLAMPRSGNPDSDLTPAIAVPIMLATLIAGLAHLAGRGQTRAPERPERS